MNKTYEDWLKYYENATKEQVIEDMMLDINNIKEKDKEIERLNNEIKTLLKENSNKEKVIIKQNNIIDEIEAIIYNTNLTGIEARIEIQERLDKLKEGK